jgi:hypothetical protein
MKRRHENRRFSGSFPAKQVMLLFFAAIETGCSLINTICFVERAFLL